MRGPRRIPPQIHNTTQTCMTGQPKWRSLCPTPQTAHLHEEERNKHENETTRQDFPYYKRENKKIQVKFQGGKQFSVHPYKKRQLYSSTVTI